MFDPKISSLGKAFFFKETFMTHRDTHEHENNKVFSYQRFIQASKNVLNGGEGLFGLDLN